jgi:hypothetical protein
MNRLILIGAILVVVATFLITNAPNMTMAFSCSSTSSTQHTNAPSQISGSSGSCATSSSASTSSSRQTSLNLNTSPAPVQFDNQQFFLTHNGGIEGSTSVASGGAQASCSSSFAAGSGGLSLTGTSISQPSHCP